MILKIPNNIQIRPLNDHEEIPYELLLLADPSKNLIDEYIRTSDIYVIELNEDIVGTYVLCPLNSDSVAIKIIAVHTSHQGKGLGKLLLSDAIQTAREKRFSTMVIGTANSSIGQLYLYQKFGFEIIEIKNNFFINNYQEPIYENGIQAKHMIVLFKQLS